MTHQTSSMNSRRSSRRPSFILVTKEEPELMSGFSVIGNMGIPILYIAAGATAIIGIICMGIITKYWSTLTPPTCFLYSQTVSSYKTYAFGTSLGTCYWVTYGSVPAVIICLVCGVIYVYHIRGDKEITLLTYICVLAMFIATILTLAVACSLTQGYRITCANINSNQSNNKGRDCKEMLDSRVERFNLPVKTSSMITASLANFWISTTCFMLITTFHIALVIRRTTTY